MVPADAAFATSRGLDLCIIAAVDCRFARHHLRLEPGCTRANPPLVSYEFIRTIPFTKQVHGYPVIIGETA